MHRHHRVPRLVAVALVALGLIAATATVTPAAEAGRTTRGTLSSAGNP